MSNSETVPPRPLLRLCLDLNVFVADLLSRRLAHDGKGAAGYLVEAVRRSVCPVGPVQLVISHGMLDRLWSVLVEQLGTDHSIAQRVTDALAAMAANGPSWTPPHIVLGGVGVLPLRDAEDRGVLETALAGRAHVLATSNLRDFVGGFGKGFCEVLSPGQALLYRPPRREPLIIARPALVARWLRFGMFPSEEAVRVDVGADWVRLNRSSREVTVGSRPVRLTTKEYGVLELMLLHKGVALSKEHILSHLYGADAREWPTCQIVDVFVVKLRKKLMDAGAGDLIRTVWGTGYMFTGRVEPIDE